MESPGAADRGRVHAWLAASVHRRVAVAMIGATLAFTLLVASASYWAARVQLTRTVLQQLESEAVQEAKALGFPLTAAAEDVAALARNRLLSQALVDSDGRAQYVTPFLRDFQPSQALRVALTLCDYRGAVIASSQQARGPGFVGASWLQRVIDAGQAHAEIGGPPGQRRILLANPVRHPETRQPEGFLVAELEARQVLGGLEAGALGAFRLRLVDGQGRVLADDGEAGAWTDMLTSGTPIIGTPMLAELGLRVEVGTPKALALRALRNLAIVYLIATAVVVLAALLVARALADRLTRPIRSLSLAAARIAESGRFDAGVEVPGRDEIGQLATTFNEMLRRLQQVTEARVAELRIQNEQLVRAHGESKRLELELHQAQKLEAVGRLAAGIAHEINTPIQYIGDNTRFMEDAVQALTTMLDRQRAELDRCAPMAAREALAAAEEELDLAYVREQAPRTISRTLEGTRRVATIVRAMKEFAHQDQKEMVATDLNRALQATLEVARNEYKYVAEVDAEYAELPLVVCRAGDVNQVFLNVIVNAAHAIADKVGDSGQRGRITVRTARDGDEVVVSIADTGGGIPEAIRDKIFDPFFTTKEVGRGSGQGLAIARNIVEKHKGSLRFESVDGQGTTFLVRLPVVGPQAGPERGAR